MNPVAELARVPNPQKNLKSGDFSYERFTTSHYSRSPTACFAHYFFFATPNSPNRFATSEPCVAVFTAVSIARILPFSPM